MATYRKPMPVDEFSICQHSDGTATVTLSGGRTHHFGCMSDAWEFLRGPRPGAPPRTLDETPAPGGDMRKALEVK